MRRSITRTPLLLAFAAPALLSCEPDVAFEQRPPEVIANPPARLDGEPIEQRVVEPGARAADVLWVVDNSCSMSEEQQRIADNAPAFINNFLSARNLDWHIGFVTTDTFNNDENGKLLSLGGGSRYMTPSTPNAFNVFSATIAQGNGGGAPERGLDTSYRALTDPLRSGVNAGFYREDAGLHIIVISDQRDYSNSVTRNEYIAWLSSLKSTTDIPVTFSVIIGIQGDTCPGYVEPGDGYSDVNRAIGGIEISICEDNWEPVLDALGRLAVGNLVEYYLEAVPYPETIELFVEDSDGSIYELFQPDDFTYNATRNSVVLDGIVPGPGSEAIIRYLPREDNVDPGAEDAK